LDSGSSSSSVSGSTISARQRDALLLAADSFARIALRQRREPRGARNAVELLLDRRAVDLPQLQPVHDVLGTVMCGHSA
jgi:hypothetical protein